MAWRRAGKVVAVGLPAFVGCAAAWRWKNRVELPHHELLDLHGRNIVLTGGTSGIGRALATELAARGAHVVVGCRDLSRGEALEKQLPKEKGTVSILHLDLEDPGSISDFVAGVKQQLEGTAGLHALVNSAAEIKSELLPGLNGVDATFAINHLGPQQLISSLAPELRRAASADRHARVVLLGSRLEHQGVVDLETLKKEGSPDPRMSESFDPMKNYGSSKLANMLLCRELHRRFAPVNVDVSIVSPGMVNTDLWRNFPLWYRILTYPLRVTLLRSPEEAAGGVLYALAAREAEGISGKYFSDGKLIEPSVAAQKSDAAAFFAYCSKMIEEAKVASALKRMGIDPALARHSPPPKPRSLKQD